MQREDVERLIAELGSIRLEGVQEDCWAGSDTLRALLAERDAAFAAGQRDMQERAAQEQEDCWKHGVPAVEHAKHIRALPIKPRP